MNRARRSQTSPSPSAGRKSNVEWISVDDLLLDFQNPRLPHFKLEPSQEQLLELIVKRYSVMELVESFAVNGYFEEEPLVAIAAPNDAGKFIIVEGNRRLAALFLLIDPERAKLFKLTIPRLDSKKLNELRFVPVRVHETRAEVLPYLGYRHITGVMQWDSYSKARYVAQLVQQGADLQSIQRRIGDRHETASRLYRAYLVWDRSKTEGLLTQNGSAPPFSYMFTALTFKPILDFLGLVAQGVPRPVPEDHVPQLLQLATYLYGDMKSGRAAAIKESRQIKYLAQALASQSGREKLEAGAKVDEAVDAIPALEARVERLLNRAAENLLSALELAPEHPAPVALQNLATRCFELAQQLRKVLRRK